MIKDMSSEEIETMLNNKANLPDFTPDPDKPRREVNRILLWGGLSVLALVAFLASSVWAAL